jgi:hypothetical protein
MCEKKIMPEQNAWSPSQARLGYQAPLQDTGMAAWSPEICAMITTSRVQDEVLDDSMR